LPEIVQGLNRASKKPVKVAFTPHLVPMIRGILATLYAPLATTGVDLQALYEKRYANEPFVDVMPPGSMPDTRSVRASNTLRIAVHRPPGTDLALVLAVSFGTYGLVKAVVGVGPVEGRECFAHAPRRKEIPSLIGIQSQALPADGSAYLFNDG